MLALDQVSVGDWLICIRGNRQVKFTPWGEKVESINRSMEGCLFRVLAVSGNVMIMMVYPTPVDPDQIKQDKPWTGSFMFNECLWQRAGKPFVRTYLKLMRRVPPAKPRTKVLTVRELSDMYEKITRVGPSPDALKWMKDRPKDDDDESKGRFK